MPVAEDNQDPNFWNVQPKGMDVSIIYVDNSKIKLPLQLVSLIKNIKILVASLVQTVSRIGLIFHFMYFKQFFLGNSFAFQFCGRIVLLFSISCRVPRVIFYWSILPFQNFVWLDWEIWVSRKEYVSSWVGLFCIYEREDILWSTQWHYSLDRVNWCDIQSSHFPDWFNRFSSTNSVLTSIKRYILWQHCRLSTFSNFCVVLFVRSINWMQ